MKAVTADVPILANRASDKVHPRSVQGASTSFAIALRLREIFSAQTVPTVAAWLHLKFETAKSKLRGNRDFTLEEVEHMLHSKEGFQVLCALMERCPNPPDWWVVCDSLMELADIERMKAVVARRVRNAVRKHEDSEAILDDQIGRAQAMAIRGSGPASIHRDALQSMARPSRRVVAKK